MIGELEEQDHLHACMLCRNDQEGAGTSRSRCRVSRKKIHAKSPTAKKEKKGKEDRGPKEGTCQLSGARVYPGLDLALAKQAMDIGSGSKLTLSWRAGVGRTAMTLMGSFYLDAGLGQSWAELMTSAVAAKT
ncbi:UNVERIFIED_CONTAM: hypothetical protein K2H54_030935 [Gekko kuhli]